VIQACADNPREGQPGTWIVPEMIAAYSELHRAGHAHSVETWVNGELAGGLYCVNLGGMVFGESMFAHQTDASKIALAGLVAFCKAKGLPLIDCQQNTGHLASLGAAEMTRADFAARVNIQTQLTSPQWLFEDLYWQTILTPQP
jgi:leucyl/phenylalanyl-tRNA--protein transferase